MQATLQRSGSCVVQTTGPVNFTVPTNDSSQCRCLFMFVSCIRRCLFTDLCQNRVGRRYVKTNVKWFGGRHSELLTI